MIDEQELRERAATTEEPQPHRLKLPEVRLDLPPEQRPAEAMRIAQEAFALTGSWVEFYREILGVEGVVHRLFPDADAMQRFRETREYDQIQQMLAALRSRDPAKIDAVEPQRMITVRLPKSLHDALRAEADQHDTSINKLCISKLLQAIDESRVPQEQGKRRGRRPGPQKQRIIEGSSAAEEERASGE